MASPVVLEKERKCKFCKIKENNKLKYGPLYELTNMVAHYYCVLCSTQMKQNGKDNEGIMGFLLNDINIELRRTKNVICAYCPENNATVECAHSGCKKVFHFPCGLQQGAVSRFRNDFATFCGKHRPKQKVPKKILNEAANTEVICAICYEEVQITNRIDNLWAPCCLKTWYHRNCVQELAHSSGYFFRCATCNDVEKFKAHMEENGIFVPQQDASWELVPNAYEELLVRHNRCDADKCKCPKGREENIEETRWEIILCRFCGSQGIHVGCGNLKFSDPQWECPTCQSIMKTDSESDKSENKIPAKKCSCNDEPQTTSRKRKMSGQPKTLNKRKRGKGNGDDSGGNPSNSGSKKKAKGKKEAKEFRIRIPGEESDKPHTATRPDDEDKDDDVEEKEEVEEEEAAAEEEEEDEDMAEDKDTDEEVDVISVDTAWLMVEEVLSRVQPAPLSYKLSYLRQKCFSYHFDPFDVREDVEIVDLTSDSEDGCLVLESDTKADTDSDIEFIGEVRESSNIEKPRKESQEMDPTQTLGEDQEIFDLSEIPMVPEELEPFDHGISEVPVAPEGMELFEIPEEAEQYEPARGSEGSEPAHEPTSDLSQGCEQPEAFEDLSEGSDGHQFVVFPEFPDIRPPSNNPPQCEVPGEDANVEGNRYEEESGDTDLESELDYFLVRKRLNRNRNRNRYAVPEQKYEDISDDNEVNLQEPPQRKRARQYPASDADHDLRAKRARTATATIDNMSFDVGGQYQVYPQSEFLPIQPDSQPVAISDPLSNQMYPSGDINDGNERVFTALDLTSFRIVEPSSTSMIVSNPQCYLLEYNDNIATPLLSASAVPSTSTAVIYEFPSTIEASLPSTSGMTLPFPYNSQMASLVPSTSGIALSASSATDMALSMPSASDMELSMPPSVGMEGAVPSDSNMEVAVPSDSNMEVAVPSDLHMEETLPSNSDMEISMSPPERQPASGECTPLPSFQYLTSLRVEISPLRSSSPSSSSSNSNFSHRHHHQTTQTGENSSSSENSNDVSIVEDTQSKKPAP